MKELNWNFNCSYFYIATKWISNFNWKQILIIGVKIKETYFEEKILGFQNSKFKISKDRNWTKNLKLDSFENLKIRKMLPYFHQSN